MIRNLKRLLITGGSGLLGLNWACSARDTWNVIVSTHQRQVKLNGVETVLLNLEDEGTLAVRIRTIKPDIVVHTAGMTNVDECEADPKTAAHVNAKLASNVAAATFANEIPLIHISTDHLFRGDCSFALEEDMPAPINEYAKSKLFAEQLVRYSHPGVLILRTNFFGWGHAYRSSFSDWIITSLRAKKKLWLFEDVHFTPLLADELVSAAHLLIDRKQSGIYNVVGAERVSKYEFGLRLAKSFQLSTELIKRGSIKMARISAQRPRDMSLANTKLTAETGYSFVGLDSQFHRLRDQEEMGRSKEIFRAVVG